MKYYGGMSPVGLPRAQHIGQTLKTYLMSQKRSKAHMTTNHVCCGHFNTAAGLLRVPAT